MTNKQTLKSILMVQLAIIGIIPLVILAYSVPESTIYMSKITKARSVGLFPEGWAFFTKDPKEEEYYFYKYDPATKTVTKETALSGSFSNLLGLNRDQRMKMHEIAAFRSSITSSDWKSITGLVTNNIAVIDTLKSIPVRNTSLSPFFASGTYLVQGKKPINWVWAKNPDLVNYEETKICKINVINHK